MNKLFLLFILTLVSTFAFSQNINLSNKLMQEYETCRLKALEPNASISSHLWLTPLLDKAHKNWENLTPEAKELFSRYEGRPTYEGTEWIVTYGNFLFHYSTDGPEDESVDDLDENGNDIPDYVELMAEIFYEVYYLYHEETGLAVPPSDGNYGGNALYDVYIHGAEAGDGVYGFVMWEDEIGDNPNTPETEYEAATSYMVMRNNYDGFLNDDETCISVTAAHEYMHAIQNGYATSIESWFKEMCATWAEEFAFPGYDDNFQYLSTHFERPDISLFFDDDEDYPELEGHWYSTWIFAQYLTEQTSEEIIKNIYKRCVTYYALDAINLELQENYDDYLESMFTYWVITNYLITESPDFLDPFTYNRAGDYIDYLDEIDSDLAIEYDFVYDGMNNILIESNEEGNDTLMPMSADYFMMASTDNFEIELETEDENAELAFYLICVNETYGEINILGVDEDSETQTIRMENNADYDYYIPIVIRIDRDVYDYESGYYDFESVDYTLFVSELTPTNVENETTNTFVNIYPVPASDIININTNTDNLKYELYDNTGRIIGKWDNNESSIDVSNFAVGNYTMKVSQNGKPISFKKISIVR